jgi:hypothetical protein
MQAMKRTFIAGALLALPLAAQTAPLVDLTDPEGDDAGDGSLVYPREGTLAAGELDLRSLRVFAERDALRFEATFQRPIRDPATVKGTGLGGEDLSVFARRGFYAFNIDVYLDIDRVRGSGRTAALPGRGATLDAGHAWDKAVVLTPRPELMQRQLREALAEGGGDRGLLDAVHFATDVRVRGRSVSFTVPASFLGSLDAARWSITAFVTAAKTSADLGLFAGAGSALERLPLGVLRPEPGVPERAMGYRGAQPPATAIVDMLAADAGVQAAQLVPGGRLVGWGAAAVPPVAVPPVAVSPVPAPAPATATVPAAAPPPLAAASASRAGAASAPAAAPPRVPRGAAFYEEQEQRLRSLKRLRDANLISEDEYQKKRREILEAL